MNPRNTAILALVVAALGAFVWFYEIEGAEQRSEAESAAKRVFGAVDADAIDWIELESQDGEKVRLERGADEAWKLVAPLAFPADRFAADGIASTLAELEAETHFEAPEPLPSYGLDVEPRVRFGVGEQGFALRIGNETPVGGNVYMTDADGAQVYAVPRWRASALDKTVKQLRDARILDFDPVQVRRVEIQGDGGRVVLVRPEATWQLEAPVAGPADADAADGLLSDLEFLRADEFVDAPGSDAELGFDAPWLRIALERDGDEPLVLTVGAEHAANRYVRGAGSAVFEVATSRLETLPRELAAFRFKELARFDVDDATRFELHFLTPDAEPLTIDGTGGDEGWTTAPEAMQPGKASRLVSDLSLLRADAVLADALGEAERAALGLAPPRATLRVYGVEADAAPLADVRLGAPDDAQGIPAMRGDADTVFWLPLRFRESLPVDRRAWEADFRVTESPPEAEAAEETAAPDAAEETAAPDAAEETAAPDAATSPAAPEAPAEE